MNNDPLIPLIHPNVQTAPSWTGPGLGPVLVSGHEVAEAQSERIGTETFWVDGVARCRGDGGSPVKLTRYDPSISF